jgi:hypothetical protein
MANPSAGDILTYNGSQWVNQPSVGGPLTINGQTSVILADNTSQFLYPLNLYRRTSATLVSGFGLGIAFWGQDTATPNPGYPPLADIQAVQTLFAPNAIAAHLSLKIFNGNTESEVLRCTETANVYIPHSLGIANASPSSLLQVAGAIATAIGGAAANYGLAFSDSVITGDATTAAFTVTLPSASGIPGRVYTVKKVDVTAHAVTVSAAAGETIDGVLTYVLSAQWQFVTVVSDGTSKWFIVAK